MEQEHVQNTPYDPLRALEKIALDIKAIQQKYWGPLQSCLTKLEGASTGDFETNRLLASMIQSFASQLDAAFVCQRCGQAARLVYHRAGNSKHGVFSFAHTGTSHLGKSSLPRLQLMKKPADKRKRNRKNEPE